MNDGHIYEMYKDYKIKSVFWSNTSCFIEVEFPHRSLGVHKIPFEIDKNNVIRLYAFLPEFVLKDVVQRIREMKDEQDQYLWGV